jgi:hypothetical protein
MEINYEEAYIPQNIGGWCCDSNEEHLTRCWWIKREIVFAYIFNGNIRQTQAINFSAVHQALEHRISNNSGYPHVLNEHRS